MDSTGGGCAVLAPGTDTLAATDLARSGAESRSDDWSRLCDPSSRMAHSAAPRSHSGVCRPSAPYPINGAIVSIAVRQHISCSSTRTGRLDRIRRAIRHQGAPRRAGDCSRRCARWHGSYATSTYANRALVNNAGRLAATHRASGLWRDRSARRSGTSFRPYQRADLEHVGHREHCHVERAECSRVPSDARLLVPVWQYDYIHSGRHGCILMVGLPRRVARCSWRGLSHLAGGRRWPALVGTATLALFQFAFPLGGVRYLLPAIAVLWFAATRHDRGWRRVSSCQYSGSDALAGFGYGFLCDGRRPRGHRSGRVVLISVMEG